MFAIQCNGVAKLVLVLEQFYSCVVVVFDGNVNHETWQWLFLMIEWCGRLVAFDSIRWKFQRDERACL